MQEPCMSLQMDTRLSHKTQFFSALIFHYAVAALLLTHPHGGHSQQIGQPQSLVAMVGDDVTLPCHVKPATDAVNVMVEWSRRDLQPRFVHVRRSGEDRLIDQNPSYNGRTSVSIDGLKQGDTSLRLSKVKLSDEGTYRCFVPDLDTDSSVQLVVDVIKITRFSSGVLECKYSGSYPESELLWLDSEGNHLSAGPTETVRGPDDLYTVSSNLTVEKGHSNSFTCRAQEKSTSQSREKLINVPDDFFSDSSSSSAPVIIGFFVAIMAILAVVFGVWKWRQHKNKAGNYNTDEEKGKGKKNSISTESEQSSLMKTATEHNTAPSTEETGLLCPVEEETQLVMLRTKGESDNVIQKQSADAGTGSQSVMENGGQEHEVQKGGETINDLDNRRKGTESMSEETQISSLAEGERNQEKPEENTDMRTGEEESKSAVPGTEDQGLKGGNRQEDTTGGDARTDPDKEENQEKTDNESADQGSSDKGIKEHDPPEGGQTMNGLENSEEATKPVSEETHTPDPAGRDTSQDKSEKNVDLRKGKEGTKSVNTGTEGEGQKDGGGQQQDTAGGGAKTDLNKDGNKEQKQTAGQSPSDGRVQENDPPVKDNKDTLHLPEGGGQQEKNRDSKGGGGDTTSTNDAHNTTSTSPETEVQSLDKEDKDKRNPANNEPADQSSSDKGIKENDSPAGGETNVNLKKTGEPEAKEKDTPHPAEGGGHKEKTPDSRDGGDNTTPQSAVDGAQDQLVEADRQNDSHNKDENNETNSANNKTAGQTLTAGEEQQDEHQTGDGKNNEEDNNSRSNQTGPPSSANTETGIKVQTEEQETGIPC